MFDDITDKISASFKKLKEQGKLDEDNIIDALKDVKLALLESDVNFRVVNAFLKSVKRRALGGNILRSLTASQQFIKIVHDELIELLGKENKALNQSNKGLTVIMLIGLQGGGKTTTCAKLAHRIKSEGKRPYMVSVDVYRPAAIDQLKILAESIDVPCFDTDPKTPVVDTVETALMAAGNAGCSHVLIDTAGRLQMDETMMQELERLKIRAAPHEILLVADAMTGQEAVNVARSFHQRLDITGFILTKMDGDARGGATMSIRAVTQKPVKFIGVGEKIHELEPFHPDRIASKILGMGDILSLIERAKTSIDDNDAQRIEENIRKNKFTLDDFQAQIKQINKMGSLAEIMKMIPGLKNSMPKNHSLGEGMLKKNSAIITSMTAKERETHTVLNASRKNRIAKGSGTEVSDVNRLIKQFSEMKTMMKQFAGPKNKQKAMQAMKGLMQGGGGGFGGNKFF